MLYTLSLIRVVPVTYRRSSVRRSARTMLFVPLIRVVLVTVFSRSAAMLPGLKAPADRGLFENLSRDVIDLVLLGKGAAYLQVDHFFCDQPTYFSLCSSQIDTDRVAHTIRNNTHRGRPIPFDSCNDVVSKICKEDHKFASSLR